MTKKSIPPRKHNPKEYPHNQPPGAPLKKAQPHKRIPPPPRKGK